MEITGKIIAVLPERSGVAKSGNEWKSQEYVIETQEQYPKKCCFNVFGADKIAEMNIQAGEVMTVHINIDAREYNGKYYNDIRAWKVTREQQQAPQPVQQVAPQGTAVPPQTQSQADELPF